MIMHTDLMIKPNAIFYMQALVSHFALWAAHYKGVDCLALQGTIRQGRLLARIGRIPVVGPNRYTSFVGLRLGKKNILISL